MTQRGYSLAMAFALIIGILVGAAWPPPPLPKIKTDESSWSLPSTKELQRHVPQDLAEVTTRIRWNGTPKTPDEQTAWRLAGITQNGGAAILIASPNNPSEIKRIAIGEPLPDGGILLSVRGDLATIKRDDCIMSYKPFILEAVEKSAGCETPQATSTGSSQ